MTLSRYPHYKPSGIEWLGEVPVDWITLKLSRITISRCDGPFGSGLKTEHYSDEGIRVIRLQNIRSGSFDDSSQAFISSDYYAELGDHDVESGDILIAGLGDENNPVGRACVAPSNLGRSMVKADCFRFRINEVRAEPRFVAFQLSSTAKALGGALATGTTRCRMNLSETADRSIALPPIAEQRAIADFLDRETAKLDTLIAKKRAFIEKLKEKRTALISSTVTRGLNPSPKLKSSGIEWLGAMPEQWESVPLGYLVRFRGGATPDKTKPELWDGDIPWVSPKDMKIPSISDSEDHISAEALQNSPLSMIPIDSILIVVRGMILAHSFPVARTFVPVTINQDMKALVCGKRIWPSFVFWALVGFENVLVSLADESAHGTRKLQTEVLQHFPMLVPPVPEQRAIADYLDRETANLDRLVDKTEAAIAKLQEYRSALLTAAVTGKIDVRNGAKAA